jgi:hypothetical protein
MWFFDDRSGRFAAVVDDQDADGLGMFARLQEHVHAALVAYRTAGPMTLAPGTGGPRPAGARS